LAIVSVVITLLLILIPAEQAYAICVAATIPVGTHSNGVEVNPTTNTVYVTNNNSNTVSVLK